MRGDKCYWRYDRPQVDPQTPRQMDSRANLSAASQFWTYGLTQFQRDAWYEWAMQVLVASGKLPNTAGAGQQAYNGIQTIRQAMGNGLATDIRQLCQCPIASPPSSRYRVSPATPTPPSTSASGTRSRTSPHTSFRSSSRPRC